MDFGRPITTFSIGGVSGRIDLRVVSVVTILAVLTVVVAVVSLMLGDYHMTLEQIWKAIVGGGDPLDRTVVMNMRMPRITLAVLLGIALGISGAIIQSLTKNPLGSPDVIGFNTGAYTGVLLLTLVMHSSDTQKSYAALAGGILTALAVYLLAYKRGVQGFRLIIVGIAVSAMLSSLNTYLVLVADLDDAMYAAAWGAGTLNGTQWGQTRAAAVAIAVILVLLLPLSRRMGMLEMGDDAARALGIRTEPTRLALLVLGVALTAVATAAAGPISFVALAAPQLARRLTGSPGVALIPAAAMGALMLVFSDVLAERLFAPTKLPVGVVTVSIGGVYLMYLIARESRKQ
ncbi:MAG: iron chelate uptake ABC transporter family permease subunit [Gordonia sp. (in: high G+C Gram-positive bacteria)]